MAGQTDFDFAKQYFKMIDSRDFLTRSMAVLAEKSCPTEAEQIDRREKILTILESVDDIDSQLAEPGFVARGNSVSIIKQLGALATERFLYTLILAALVLALTFMGWMWFSKAEMAVKAVQNAIITSAAAATFGLSQSDDIRVGMIIVLGAVAILILFVMLLVWAVSKEAARRREAKQFLHQFIVFTLGLISGFAAKSF